MYSQAIANLKAGTRGFYTKVMIRYAGPYRQRRAWLGETQWYSKEKLQQMQLGLLKVIVKHAYETVPYYREVMDEDGIKPEDIKGLEDIKLFRVIGKQDVRDAGSRMYSEKFNRLFVRTARTGATTGPPVAMRRDIFSIGNEHAFVRRQYDWAGLSINDRCAVLKWRRLKDGDSTKAGRYCYDAAMKELILSTFHLTDKAVVEYANLMRFYKVAALVAYPSAAYVMARGCLERGIKLPLKAVLTTAETLDDGKRELISRAFGCKVFDFYGSAERVCYIHSCECGNYHILPEYGLAELHPAESESGGCHRIIATGFWNMAMPLIRYDTGDLVVVNGGECTCGRNFIKIKKILGRDGDMITAPSGATMGVAAIDGILGRIIYGMYDMPVLAGRVVQESEDLVTLEYVAADGFDQRHMRRLTRHFNEQLKGRMRGKVRRVERIERTPSGKFISFVSPRQQQKGASVVKR